MQELIKKNREGIIKHRENFRHTFGVDLNKFMHPLLGFDVIAFDGFLKTPDGISTNDYILQNYGQQALDMVKAMI